MLSDRVCIVCGAGSGIGEAVSVELGRQGATVVVNDLGTDVTGEGESEQPAEETATLVREAGGDALTHFGDVSSLSYTERLVDDTVEEYGRIDGVANFAGILDDSISYKMSGDAWDRVIRVHLRGHFALLRNAGRHWRDRAGDGKLDTQRSFLAVSSRSALGSVGQLNYSAAKAGVLGLTRTASLELSRYNVRVNALMPTANTRMIERIPEEQRSELQEEPPEKVAPAVAYLLSDAAEGINGCTVRAAGDSVGLMSNPETERLAFREGGWTVESLSDRFDAIGAGLDLDRSDPAF